MWLVSVWEGDKIDSVLTPKFVTESESDANEWVSKFNKIVKNNVNRLARWDYEGDTPFWHDYIVYYNPYAIVKEIEKR